MATTPDTVKLGSRYHRLDRPKPVYRVVRLVLYDHHSPHLVLVSENPEQRLITVGVSVLLDERQWVPVK